MTVVLKSNSRGLPWMSSHGVFPVAFAVTASARAFSLPFPFRKVTEGFGAQAITLTAFRNGTRREKPEHHGVNESGPTLGQLHVAESALRFLAGRHVNDARLDKGVTERVPLERLPLYHFCGRHILQCLVYALRVA